MDFGKALTVSLLGGALLGRAALAGPALADPAQPDAGKPAAPLTVPLAAPKPDASSASAANPNAPKPNAADPAPPAPAADDEAARRRARTNDRRAFREARLAALCAGLQLTGEQQPLWAPVEGALRDLDVARHALRRGRREAMMDGMAGDGAARLKERGRRLVAMGQALGRLADAAAPLTAALSPEQKGRLPVLLRGVGPRRAVAEAFDVRFADMGRDGMGRGSIGYGGMSRGEMGGRLPPDLEGLREGAGRDGRPGGGWRHRDERFGGDGSGRFEEDGGYGRGG